MKIITDKDKNLKFERSNILKKFLRFIFYSIFNLITIHSRKFIKTTDKSASRVIDNATTHLALEILYNHGYIKDDVSIDHSKDTLMEKIFRNFWFRTANAKAVRNRFKLVKREIIKVVEIFSKSKKEINILSIASGSARVVIESIECLYKTFPSDFVINCVFLDKNQEALNYSKKIINQKTELKNDNNINFTWINDTVENFLNNKDQKENKFDLVEIVGLLDYFDNKKTTRIFSKINKILNYEGILIASNIIYNKESEFITKVVGWPMVYKDLKEFCKLSILSGFKSEKITGFYEPLKIHGIIVASK